MFQMYPSSNRYQFYFNRGITYRFEWMAILIKKAATPITDQRIGHSTANYSRIMKISAFVPKTIIFEKIKKDKL